MGRRVVSFVKKLLLIFYVALSFGAAPVLSYPTPKDFNGKILRWDIDSSSPNISYRVKFEGLSDQPALTSIVSTAAQKWSQVSSSYVRYVEALPDEDEQVAIVIKPSIAGGAFSSGVAYFDERDDSDKPAHCTIEVPYNGGIALAAFQKTILHELGHCLGLGHSMIPESIMSYVWDKNSYALDIDDQAALTRLYPASGSDPKLALGCAVAIGGSQNYWSSDASIVAMLLLCLPIFAHFLLFSRFKIMYPLLRYSKKEG